MERSTLGAYAARRARRVGPAGQVGTQAGPAPAIRHAAKDHGQRLVRRLLQGFGEGGKPEASVPGLALPWRAWDDGGVISRYRGLHVAIGAVGLAAGIAAFALTLARDHDELRAVGHPEEAGFVLAIGWSFIAPGMVSWGRRPHSRFGPPMVAV